MPLAAEQAVRQALAQLHTGLVEGVDSIQLPGERGRGFEQEEEPTEGLGVEPRDGDLQARPSVLGQRQRRRAALVIEQLGETVPAQVLVGARLGGDGELSPAIGDRDEGEQLVPWTLHEELHLRVLVGRAHGRDRGRARLDDPALSIDSLPQALRPELDEPRCERAQPVGVGHQHVHVPAVQSVVEDMDRREQSSRVLRELGLGAALGHLRRAVEHGGDVDTTERGGQEPHGGEDGEAPAHGGRDGEGAELLRVRQLAQ